MNELTAQVGEMTTSCDAADQTGLCHDPPAHPLFNLLNPITKVPRIPFWRPMPYPGSAWP